MFLSESLWNLLQPASEDPEMDERLGRLQADLEIFVEGQPIDPKYLFFLSPGRDAIWEIRSSRPEPSIRVLGLFAEYDVFIATNFALRDELGGWESQAWRDAKKLARTRWTNLFHTYQPLNSPVVSDLVSGAIDGKYFKG
jgi:hypothetical protein